MSVKPTIVELILNATTAGKAMLSAANAAAQKTLLSLVKGDVGLGNVDNTSDASKPVSTAQQTELDAKQATLVSGTNIKTVNGATLLGSGDITAGLSGTGSVDNAVIRADGTGGATLQSSAWIIHDNLTASPNNTINHACIEATGGTTNVSVSIKPKGTGAFCLSAPDGTATNGNVRGANAIDLQTYRTTAARVASGDGSVVVGTMNTASGSNAVAIGYNNQVSAGIGIGGTNICSGTYAVGLGDTNSSSGTSSVAIGFSNSASQSYAVAIGLYASADRRCQFAFSGGRFGVNGDCQRTVFILRGATTNATPLTLALDASTRLTIPSGKMLFADVLISGIKSDGSAVACYKRKVGIKNVSGTTSLVGSVETIGTDIEDNASTDVTIAADNTNDALQVSVTGITAETWRWIAVVEGLEIAYGT